MSGVDCEGMIWRDGWMIGWMQGWMEGLGLYGRPAGVAPDLLGNDATSRGDRREDRGSSESRGRALPAVGRLGRASPPLFVWLWVCGARGNQENIQPFCWCCRIGCELCSNSAPDRKSEREKNFGMPKIVAVERTKGNKSRISKSFSRRNSNINLKMTGFLETKSLAGIFGFDGN